MNIVIVGLGLIGGSYARAIKKYTDHTVIGIDNNSLTLEKALSCGAIDAVGSSDSLKTADVTIICLYPEQIISFVRENGDKFRKNSIVTDGCGIKTYLCDRLCAMSREYGFYYVGGHPMAGKEVGGFSNSEAELFRDASYICVPCGDGDDEGYSNAVDTLCALAKKIGFGRCMITTPEEHDRMIAYTSQIPHVLACAYILNPNALKHNGFSAGSFRDVSRVAKINAELWTELFDLNKDALSKELDNLIDNLSILRDTIASGNREKLEELLMKGNSIKESI